MNKYQYNYYTPKANKKREEYTNIFNTLINSNNFQPYYLTTKEFKKQTGISVDSFSRMFNMNWLEVLDNFNVKHILYDYIINEYNHFYLLNYQCSFDKFCEDHKYITKHLIILFSRDKIKLSCGFKGSHQQHNFDGLKNNIYDIINILGRIPFCSEFIKYTKINISSYLLYFELDNQDYNFIIENIVKEQSLIDEYYNLINKRDKNIQSIGGKHNGEINGYSDEEKEIEFKRVFENFYKEHGVYPTRRIFNKLSKYSDGTYRKKSKRTWNETVKFYGYPITNKNISEIICLNYISKILNNNYIHQKSWDWLKSSKNHFLYVDGYYPKYDLIVEFDGIGHRKPVYGEETFLRTKENDKIKNNLIPQHGCKLLRIDSRSNWDNINFLADQLIKIGILKAQKDEVNL